LILENSVKNEFKKNINTDEFEVRIYPYGNAKQVFVDDEWLFECQHGENECHLNRIHACVMQVSFRVDFNFLGVGSFAQCKFA